MAKEKNIEEETKVVEESQAKKDFRLVIENYKKSNPKKYALKEAELEAKLNAIK